MAEYTEGDAVTEYRVEQIFQVQPAKSLENIFSGIDIPHNPGLADNSWNSSHQDSYCSESVKLTGPTGKKLRLIKQYNPYGSVGTMACNRNNQLIGVTIGQKPQLVVFDKECHILSASQLGVKKSKDFSEGYFYLNNEDNAVVVSNNSLACYPTARVTPRDEVYGLNPLWTSADLVQAIIGKPTDKNSLYGGMPVFTQKPGLYWVMLAGSYDRENKKLESNTFLAVVEIIPDQKQSGCRTTVVDRVELHDQWSNNTMAVSENGVFFVTNGCNKAGTCTTGFLHCFDFDQTTSKIRQRWVTPYENSGYLKPGLKNIGSGTTPTLFQGEDGSNLVAIVDNAYPRMNVIVMNRDSGVILEKVPMFPKMRGCDESSLIGANGRIVVENNFGHTVDGPYSQYVPNEPGMAMIKLNSGGGYETVWENTFFPSSIFATSMLARESGIIFAHTGEWNIPDSSTKGGLYNLVAIDSWDGRIIWRIPIGQGRKYCHEYGGVYFNRSGTGLYMGTEKYLVSIQNWEKF